MTIKMKNFKAKKISKHIVKKKLIIPQNIGYFLFFCYFFLNVVSINRFYVTSFKLSKNNVKINLSERFIERCDELLTCDACLNVGQSCGWCYTDGLCKSGNTIGPTVINGCNWADWQISKCQNRSCESYTNILSCISQTDCFWCESEGSSNCLDINSKITTNCKKYTDNSDYLKNSKSIQNMVQNNIFNENLEKLGEYEENKNEDQKNDSKTQYINQSNKIIENVKINFYNESLTVDKNQNNGEISNCSTKKKSDSSLDFLNYKKFLNGLNIWFKTKLILKNTLFNSVKNPAGTFKYQMQNNLPLKNSLTLDIGKDFDSQLFNLLSGNSKKQMVELSRRYALDLLKSMFKFTHTESDEYKVTIDKKNYKGVQYYLLIGKLAGLKWVDFLKSKKIEIDEIHKLLEIPKEVINIIEGRDYNQENTFKSLNKTSKNMQNSTSKKAPYWDKYNLNFSQILKKQNKLCLMYPFRLLSNDLAALKFQNKKWQKLPGTNFTLKSYLNSTIFVYQKINLYGSFKNFKSVTFQNENDFKSLSTLKTGKFNQISTNNYMLFNMQPGINHLYSAYYSENFKLKKSEENNIIVTNILEFPNMNVDTSKSSKFNIKNYLYNTDLVQFKIKELTRQLKIDTKDYANYYSINPSDINTINCLIFYNIFIPHNRVDRNLFFKLELTLTSGETKNFFGEAISANSIWIPAMNILKNVGGFMMVSLPKGIYDANIIAKPILENFKLEKLDESLYNIDPYKSSQNNTLLDKIINKNDKKWKQIKSANGMKNNLKPKGIINGGNNHKNEKNHKNLENSKNSKKNLPNKNNNITTNNNVSNITKQTLLKKHTGNSTKSNMHNNTKIKTNPKDIYSNITQSKAKHHNSTLKHSSFQNISSQINHHKQNSTTNISSTLNSTHSKKKKSKKKNNLTETNITESKGNRKNNIDSNFDQMILDEITYTFMELENIIKNLDDTNPTNSKKKKKNKKKKAHNEKSSHNSDNSTKIVNEKNVPSLKGKKNPEINVDSKNHFSSLQIGKQNLEFFSKLSNYSVSQGIVDDFIKKNNFKINNLKEIGEISILKLPVTSTFYTLTLKNSFSFKGSHELNNIPNLKKNFKITTERNVLIHTNIVLTLSQLVEFEFRIYINGKDLCDSPLKTKKEHVVSINNIIIEKLQPGDYSVELLYMANKEGIANMLDNDWDIISLNILLLETE
jgi:hypothetical protein